jgi:hypothetical protein
MGGQKTGQRVRILRVINTQRCRALDSSRRCPRKNRMLAQSSPILSAIAVLSEIGGSALSETAQGG